MIHHGIFSSCLAFQSFSASSLSPSEQTTYIQVFVFSNLVFGDPKPGHFPVLPAVHGHLKHSCTATVVFEAFQHLTVLAFGCWLPRLAAYLGSCAEMNSVYSQLRLWLMSLCPVVKLVHSSPPISCRSVPLFHRWHLTGSLLMTGSGTFVQKNASLTF